MAKMMAGDMDGRGKRFAIVVARFNEFITEKLLKGAIETLGRHGADLDQVTVAWVPGAFEIPLAAQKLAAGGRYAAVLCLGCVIRGETPHFEHVAGQCAAGVMQAGLATGVPILFGVVTADTFEQALDRAGGKAGNKGSEAAAAAVEMAGLVRRLEAGDEP